MLVDAHSHLDRYDLVGEEALQRALSEIEEHQILTISNSMDPASYQRNVVIGQMCDWVLPTFGVHPWNAPQYAHRLEELDQAIEQSPMLGEIGLDCYFIEDASAYPDQKRVFEYLLAAAKQQDKIVSLHTKGAETAVLELLDRCKPPRVIIHWYSGPRDTFRAFVSRGVYFTIGVEVLYSEHIQALAREIPAGRLLTETDNPGGPQGFLGRPGMPLLVQDVVQTLATVRNVPVEVIARMVQANLYELCRDDPWLRDTCIAAKVEP